jgi:hypothetical protein
MAVNPPNKLYWITNQLKPISLQVTSNKPYMISKTAVERQMPWIIETEKFHVLRSSN